MTLYVTFGGPIPFVATGGPALGSVPSNADVVVYTDAWSFSSETSRNVVDGILTVSNESLPGYTGPASLNRVFEILQNTSLNPTGLRSVTAFGSYDERGRVGKYQGLILKTTWGRNQILSAFGDGRDAYEKRTYRSKTVFVDPSGNSTLPWVARLNGDQFVLGTRAAVEDSIDARAGHDSGMNATLKSRFHEMGNAPVKFVAGMPAEVPGSSFVPDTVTRTIAGIETVGGVYYPNGEDATVKLTVGTTDAANASRLEPAMHDALATAREYVPASMVPLLRGASVGRSKRSVTVGMSGSADAFVGGYRALVRTGVVNLLVGEPVGDPALQLVPADATAVGYADASLVTDPTAQLLFERLLSAGTATNGNATNGNAAQRVFDGLDTVSVSELSSFRSVTVFGRGIETDDTQAAAIVQADLDRTDVRDALDAANTSYHRERYRGRPVFVVTEENESVWITPLHGSHQVLGTAGAVRDVIEVASGDRASLSGPLGDAVRNRTSYLRVASVVPAAVTDAAGPLSGVVEDVEVIAANYDTVDGRAVARVDLHFDSLADAKNGRDGVSALLTLGSGSFDDHRLQRLVESTDVRRSGRVVTLTAETDPETLLALIDRLAGAVDATTGSAARQATLLSTPVPPASDPP